MMKLRLPHPFRRHDPVPELGILDPGVGLRILEPPGIDEGVRRVPVMAGEAHLRKPPPPPLEAGYRWGMAAARVPCDLSAHADFGEPAGAVEIVGGDHLPAVRFERAVLAVAARTEVLASAVTRLHERLEELDDRFIDVVTHEDLVELESRRARLAAEVSRLSVEMKAEVDRRINELGRVVAETKQRAATVDHLGPLDLAEARRVEIQLDHLTGADKIADLDTRRTA